jgi:hypothetical protein
MRLKLYLLTQNDNNGYDTYDSCIVCAKNEDEAKTISPEGGIFVETTGKRSSWHTAWAKRASSITCEEIGTANENQKKGVILSSFNAG